MSNVRYGGYEINIDPTAPNSLFGGDIDPAEYLSNITITQSGNTYTLTQERGDGTAEVIGTITVEAGDFVTEAELQTALEDYLTSAEFQAILADYQTAAQTQSEINTAVTTAQTETEGKLATTNSGKRLAQARRVQSGNTIYAALVDEDGVYNNIYGLPSGASAGAYLKTDGTLSGSGWETPDTTPTSGSAALITSGGVYNAIQGAINASY